MQAGSTGLGKVSLKMNLIEKEDVSRHPPTLPPEDSLVFYAKSYDPVVWNIWLAIDEDEVPKVLKQLLRPKILLFVLKSCVRSIWRHFKAS